MSKYGKFISIDGVLYFTDDEDPVIIVGYISYYTTKFFYDIDDNVWRCDEEEDDLKGLENIRCMCKTTHYEWYKNNEPVINVHRVEFKE